MNVIASNLASNAALATPNGTTRPQVSIVIVGHVDHGKSTLVGRLLHETGSLPDGKLEMLKAVSARRGMPFEWSFLLDALQTERDQADAIVGKHLARRLWSALKAREGDILSAFLNHDAMEILDPTYRAAAILFARSIYVEPCRRLIPAQPIVYLAMWPDGSSRNLSEADLLNLAGIASE